MTFPTLRIGLVLLVATPLAAAWAQTNAPAPGASGVTLGWTAQIDATVLDVPPEAVDVTRVAASSADDVDIALLARERDSAGGPQLRGTLPDLRGSPLLQPITSERLWTCAMQAGADARFAPVTLWAVGAPAVLELVNAPLPDEPAPGYRQLLLLFADTDVRVQGSCPEAPTSLQVDLHLRPGWNLVTSELLTPPTAGRSCCAPPPRPSWTAWPGAGATPALRGPSRWCRGGSEPRAAPPRSRDLTTAPRARCRPPHGRARAPRSAARAVSSCTRRRRSPVLRCRPGCPVAATPARTAPNAASAASSRVPGAW